jgi:hypothetical protein
MKNLIDTVKGILQGLLLWALIILSVVCLIGIVIFVIENLYVIGIVLILFSVFLCGGAVFSGLDKQ